MKFEYEVENLYKFAEIDSYEFGVKPEQGCCDA
jgi:hypothetical protein